MKLLCTTITFLFCLNSYSQNLQLHYDARHTIAPKRNSRNFATVYFEYFKTLDSGKSLVKPGSFLIKIQSDLAEEHSNMSKFYMQLSQTFRMWKPKIFINLQYSGGLGITEPKEYSYYIVNTYFLGLSYPFKWHNAYLNAVVNYKCVPYKKISNDALFTLYWWKGLWNYKAELAGDFSVWTENKNHGDDLTKDLKGKRFSFFAEPQCWYNLNSHFSAGTRLNMYYHVNTTDNIFEIYPTIGIKCRL